MTFFHLFIKLSNILLYICTISSLSIDQVAVGLEDFRLPVCRWVGLCSCSFGCLARGILTMEPAVCCVGPGLGVKMVVSRKSKSRSFSLRGKKSRVRLFATFYQLSQKGNPRRDHANYITEVERNFKYHVLNTPLSQKEKRKPRKGK